MTVRIRSPFLTTTWRSPFEKCDIHFLHALTKVVTFQVALYNYQAQENDPAVLAILVSAYGSSAQIVDRKWDGVSRKKQCPFALQECL